MNGGTGMRLDKASCGNWWREGWKSDQVFVSAADRQILRELAMHLREYAELSLIHI